MLEIDGSLKSGSGTILRMSVALAAIVDQPLHIFNIRQKRPQPGLHPQHLEAVLTAAKLCNAEVKGATLGSRELWFTPEKIEGGKIKAEIGTAGSIPMLLFTVLPLCVFANTRVWLRVSRGGTDVRNAPTINYLKNVLFEVLKRMGLKVSLTIQKYGYYPKGMGEITLEVQPCTKLRSIRIEEFGRIEDISGLSVCTFLANRKVADRQAKAANLLLEAHGYKTDIQVIDDTSNSLQKGSSLVIWAKTDRGAVLGADAIGELGKPSEDVGKEVAEKFLKEVESKATVDVNLADMLVPYIALSEGESVYLSRLMTCHLDTNIWIAQKILGVKFRITKVGDLFRVEKRE